MIRNHQELLNHYWGSGCSDIWNHGPFGASFDEDQFALSEEVADYADRHGLDDPSSEWRVRYYDRRYEESLDDFEEYRMEYIEGGS